MDVLKSEKDSTASKLRMLSAILIPAAVLMICIYLFLWFYYKGTLHPESIGDIANFVKGMEADGIIKTCFNLQMIEGGLYRPRIGAFLIQYFDIQGWIMLNKALKWGGHYPFVIIGILTVMRGGVFDTESPG